MKTMLIQADALEGMRALDDGSVHCVITDPPYPSLDKWRNVGTTGRMGFGAKDEDKDEDKFFPTVDYAYLSECVREFHRLLPKNGHVWMMGDGESATEMICAVRNDACLAKLFPYTKIYPVLKMRADMAGFKPGMGYHGRACHEYVVLLEKGRRRFTDESFVDVFQFAWTGAAETKPHTPHGKPYPTAKPLAAYSRWLELSTEEGETALDPFAGGGVLGEACRALKRNCCLIDSSDISITTIMNRLSLDEVYDLRFEE